MKNKLINSIIAISVLLIIILLAGNSMFGDQLRAVSSITGLSDRLLYLEYNGDYGLTDLLKQGGVASDEELATFLTGFFTKGLYRYEAPDQLIGCSTIAAKLPDGGYGFGRNFDLNDCSALIVKTKPDDGYASISTTNLQFLGFDQDFIAESFMDKFLMLALIFVPLDGMNEKGLCAAINAINHSEQTNQNTGKPDLTTTAALRLILDRAANVDEALKLLSQYDMHASADSDYHFALADASGRSVVVEYIQNKMHVTETAVVTNHFLTPGSYYKIGLGSNDYRYEVLVDHLEASEGVMSHEDFKNALAATTQNRKISTQWSIIYDQSNLELVFYHLRDFNNPLYFELASQ